MSRRRRAAAALAASAFCLIACDTLKPSDPLGYVPASAVAVMRIENGTVSGDAAYGATVPPIVTQTLAERGIDLRAVRSMVFYSESLSSGDAGIVTGPGLGIAWRKAAQGDRWTSRGGVATVVLTDDSIGLGPNPQVDAMSAARRWSQGFTSRPEFDDLQDVFRQNDPVSAAVIWPTSVNDATNALTAAASGALGLAGFGSLGGIVNQLGVGRAMALGCRHQGDAMHVNVGVLMASETTASVVAGGLSIANSLGSLIGAPPGGSRPALNVVRRGAFVRVGVDVPISEWARR